MSRMRVQFQLEARFRTCPDTGAVLAWAPALDVMTQGQTEEEAQANLIDAVRLFIESCYARGVLDQALRECGFKAIPDGAPPDPKVLMIDVPMELVARDQNNARQLANAC